jgi:hypothetical protein
MAKRARARKRRVTFAQAKKVLASAGVPQQEFGQFTPQGKVMIDQLELERLQKRLGKKRRFVRFVALNAPFKRRSPIAPA